MSVMDNEGHDPQGFLNTPNYRSAPNRTEVNALKADNERLRAALKAAEAALLGITGSDNLRIANALLIIQTRDLQQEKP